MFPFLTKQLVCPNSCFSNCCYQETDVPFITKTGVSQTDASQVTDVSQTVVYENSRSDQTAVSQPTVLKTQMFLKQMFTKTAVMPKQMFLKHVSIFAKTAGMTHNSCFSNRRFLSQ